MIETTRRGFLGTLLALAAAPSVAGFMPTPVSAAVAPARYVSVLDYGADPTRGNDCTDAFRRAIAAAVAGGTVYVPPGEYRVGGGFDTRCKIAPMFERYPTFCAAVG
jgi:Pectate lyase superfamily protein